MSSDPKPFRHSVVFWDDPRRLSALRIFTGFALKVEVDNQAEGNNKAVDQFVKALENRAKLFNHGVHGDLQVRLWDRLTVKRFAQGQLARDNHECLSAIASELFRNSMSAAAPAAVAYQTMLDGGHPDIRAEFARFGDEVPIAMGVWDWREVTQREKVANAGAALGIAGGVQQFFTSLVNATQMVETQATVETQAFPAARYPKTEQIRRFLIYRNSISADRFSKMYGIFQRSGKESGNGYDQPTFSIWYSDDNGRTLQTTSIILGAQSAIYLFGAMGAGVGLNLIALARKALSAESFVGLQLTTDSNGIPIASRLLFVETQTPSFQEAGIGIWPRESLAEEALTASQLGTLSNKVGIERTDLEHDGGAVSHGDMKSMIAAQLALSPFTMRETGGAYNPADADHLPFNTALHLN